MALFSRVVKKLKSILKTFICFLIACFLIPVLLLSFIFVHCSNELVNYVLSTKYPTLTFSKSKKIRTLIDTPRNAGIFHFLLQVKGPCDFDKIRRFYTSNLTNAKHKNGSLKFPKLRQKLITCWGHYAWVNDTSSFNISNHVLKSSGTYRGRQINENNIEEFISDLVAKYIPSDLPQWQVIVIPISTTLTEATSDSQNCHFYILVKVHHMIISEEEDLYIKQILMLNDCGSKYLMNIEDLDGTHKCQDYSYFVQKPKHIYNLFNHLYKVISNHWNAFIYEFESLETPDGYTRPQITNISQLLSVLLIITVNVCSKYWKNMKTRRKLIRHSRTRNVEYSRLAIFLKLMLSEAAERNLSRHLAYNAICSSLKLANLSKIVTKIIWQTFLQKIITLPYHIYFELLAMKDLIFRGHTNLITTYCSRLSIYVPLILYAQFEFCKICYDIYKMPVIILEELFENAPKEANILQMKSYSGRKIVSFSKSIDATALRERINFSKDMLESDFILACLGGSLHNYFETFKQPESVSNIVNVTYRSIAKEYLTADYGDKTDHISGVVFLQIPLKVPDASYVKEIHAIIERVRYKQIMIYLASLGQTKFDLLTSIIPRVLTKIFINYFSYNFPVTVTQIFGSTREFKTIWGQDVNDILLFRPPQSKTCLSLNIHKFCDKYRLAVMADTQLGPDHCKIARSFEEYLENSTIL